MNKKTKLGLLIVVPVMIHEQYSQKKINYCIINVNTIIYILSVDLTTYFKNKQIDIFKSSHKRSDIFIC